MAKNIRNQDELAKEISAYRNKVKNRTAPSPVEPETSQGTNGFQVAPSVRTNVEKRGKSIEKEILARDKEFEDVGVKRDSQNHLITERSLFGDANKQAKNDPDVLRGKVDQIFSSLKKLRERKK
ncbi:hypothetical protein [Pseudoduganella violacea]|uniref:Uncharacterized protein n=1 Tax=Pseudoduganella violacea TaxID=1715466 RepID=A0A7W5BG26_9BURK|nr:hypothetical protein [Pseudoduganella violacea]MBB3122473.1 hypothetical protein [Pseudoduganella violacea]